MLLRSTHHDSSKPVAREFPIALDMQYQVLGDGTSKVRGTGRTLWMSSQKIIFEGDTALPAGTVVEITIAWPAMLDEHVGLQLWIRACVLHPLSHGIAAEIRKYQFRTRSVARAATGMTTCRQPAPEEFRAMAAGYGLLANH